MSHACEFRLRFDILYADEGPKMETAGWPNSKIPSKPFPVRLLAEVEAKVALLTELQREYRPQLEGRKASRAFQNRFEVRVEQQGWLGPYDWIELKSFMERVQKGKTSLVDVSRT